jgi:hypothetical protein
MDGLFFIVELSAELEISKSLLSDILHYRRGLSREVIRKLPKPGQLFEPF